MEEDVDDDGSLVEVVEGVIPLSQSGVVADRLLPLLVRVLPLLLVVGGCVLIFNNSDTRSCRDFVF